MTTARKTPVNKHDIIVSNIPLSLYEYITGLEMHQTANSQNVQFDTNYKHNIAYNELENFWKLFRPTTQPNPLKIL